MLNMAACMMRNLQRFVEFDLLGIVRWDKVRAVIPTDGEGNVAEASFKLDGKSFVIRVESSEFNPRNTCGCVRMNGQAYGPIDEKTWDQLALEIKTHVARETIKTTVSGQGVT